MLYTRFIIFSIKLVFVLNGGKSLLFNNIVFQIKLLIETKPIVCLPWEILHYKISREKLEPEPRFESRFWFKFFS